MIIALDTTYAIAQPQYRLEGYMGVQGGESFNYNLDLWDSVGNMLSGYAYTYKNKDNAVKAYVTAIIDKETKSLHIREQYIISNNNFQSKATICLVNAVLKWDKDENNLSGTLITQTSNNGATCSSGSITLIKKNQIQNLFAKPEPVIQKTPTTTEQQPAFRTTEDPNQKLRKYFQEKEKQKQDIEKKKTEIVTTQESLKKTKEITEGIEVTFDWHSDKVIFEIWDGGEIDNDIVSIEFNNREILSSYTLTADKKRLVFNLGDNPINTISIIAKNEGANPPNTANIKLTDGQEDHSVIAHNKVGKKAVIRIKQAERSVK